VRSAWKILKEPQAPRAMGPQTLEAQGRRRKRSTKDALPRQNRSTPLPNIPQRFEIKVTVAGPLMTGMKRGKVISGGC
jgi:hypothetical protein